MLAIRRKDNNKLACVGGFVKVGETLEEAVRREVMEETSLTVTSMQMIPRVREGVHLRAYQVDSLMSEVQESIVRLASLVVM